MHIIRLHLHYMLKRFWAIVKTYPVQRINMIGLLQNGCHSENISDMGHTTFRSRAEQQHSILKIALKIAFPM